ncbi:hypothetical protein NPIL_274321 [Nephila pilipes]|uniref:Uncharacterized protein n=1 Tax=Nephila pilipes TaxID=299642 RepID=A0A8X6T8Q8_NEPPI|nr:hypothetical protein NPIL_274321 [Nephila pilipes]
MCVVSGIALNPFDGFFYFILAFLSDFDALLLDAEIRLRVAPKTTRLSEGRTTASGAPHPRGGSGPDDPREAEDRRRSREHGGASGVETDGRIGSCGDVGRSGVVRRSRGPPAARGVRPDRRKEGLAQTKTRLFPKRLRQDRGSCGRSEAAESEREKPGSPSGPRGLSGPEEGRIGSNEDAGVSQSSADGSGFLLTIRSRRE